MINENDGMAPYRQELCRSRKKKEDDIWLNPHPNTGNSMT